MLAFPRFARFVNQLRAQQAAQPMVPFVPSPQREIAGSRATPAMSMGLPARLIKRVLHSVAVHPIASWNESFCRVLDAEASSNHGGLEGSCRIKWQLALAFHSKLVGKTDFPSTFSDGDIRAIGGGVQRIRVWADEATRNSGIYSR